MKEEGIKEEEQEEAGKEKEGEQIKRKSCMKVRCAVNQRLSPQALVLTFDITNTESTMRRKK